MERRIPTRGVVFTSTSRISSDRDFVECGTDYMLFYTGLIKGALLKSYMCYQLAVF